VEGYNTSEKLARALESTIQIVFRVEEHAKLFSMPPSSSTKRVYYSLKESMVHVLAEVLNFLIRAVRFFEKSTIREWASFQARAMLSNTL
jgi:hypothetical protein